MIQLQENLLHEMCIIINNDKKMLEEARRIYKESLRLPQSLEPGAVSRRWVKSLNFLQTKAWKVMNKVRHTNEFATIGFIFSYTVLFPQIYTEE